MRRQSTLIAEPAIGSNCAPQSGHRINSHLFVVIRLDSPLDPFILGHIIQEAALSPNKKSGRHYDDRRGTSKVLRDY